MAEGLETSSIADRQATLHRLGEATRREPTTARALAPLGLTPDAEALYRRMCSRRGVAADDICAELDLPRERASRALRLLASLGLVSGDGSAEGQSPVAPDIAIERLLAHKQLGLLAQQHQLLDVRQEIESLKRAFQQEWHLSDPTAPVEVLTGVDVASHAASLVGCAEHDYGALVVGPWGDAPTLPVATAPPGVRARIVYARDALELPGVLARAQNAARFHEEARVASDLPTRMVLVDQRAALVPLAPVASSGSLLIRSSLLVEALWALFESVWEHAVPQGADSDELDELDEHDRTIVALMAAGLKDEAIARRLGVAERTVGRRISALLAELGASTRFQAGIQAARRGWLP